MPNLSTRALVLGVLVTWVCCAVSPVAHAEKQDARRHYDQATAAFGLGRYGEAAAEYEEAFRLRPDPALLYNCAQSYRLSGNKLRALELYRNYLRLYGEAPNAEDARKHVHDLELEIAADKAATQSSAAAAAAVAASVAADRTTTPASAAPGRGARQPTGGAADDASSAWPALAASAAAAPPSAPAPAPARDLRLGEPAPASERPETPVTRRPWFWVAVGAAVVGGTVAVLLATRGENDPKATLGTAMAN
jgi:tetratricopeptide (TPR) repeat protein